MFEKLSEAPIAEVQGRQAQEWEDGDLLGRCVAAREGRPGFIFYEGPPTANGRPGIHHVIARTLKDSVCRHKTMKGFQVRRKAGWDTHGLPVEIEVEKELGLRTKKDIEDYGIREFNKKCRESVFKYEGMWREMSKRMAFMADMDHPYITLDNDYIETGWWILKEFFKAGLIYEGHKVLPYCPRCGTGLASHEVALGYKEVKTNTLTAKFKRKGGDGWFLAWTTTPWTLASNVSLTVGADVEYVKARMLEGDEAGNVFYVAKELADRTLGAGKYEVLESMPGSALEYAEYERLMPFVEVDKKAFYVTCADYVTVEDGTGIVHTAPAFGEDDYNTGRRYGLPVPNPVDEEGKYTTTPWAGRFVMEEGLDVDIIKWLAAEGKLFSREKMTHNYPHCWRCDSPLIYYSKPSWYIEMTKLKDELVANNSQVCWFPDFVGEKRFGNWLENVNDWAISRTRYWGTPIPIWRCRDCGALHCVGSRAELRELALGPVADGLELHRPDVDEVLLRCPACGGKAERVPEVMDCWFDSGAMPFAQQHYPFENADKFDAELFPADFICEGIDQTRGWFYSLIAISTFIKKTSPYKNCLVNDLILDKNGKKMSKSKGNTVDPFELFDKYGADATRWYLLYASPAWSPTKFDEEGLKEVAGKFFGTLRNVYHFFVLYANQDGIDPRGYRLEAGARPELDRWILSRYNRLIKEALEEMDRYDHMKAVRKIQYFVLEDLSNWYIRRARRRFWAEGMSEDKLSVYAVTWEILAGLAKLIAPLAPFLADEIFTKLTGGGSVHLEHYPEADESLLDDALEERMEVVRNLVALGRGAREKERLKVRQPLGGVLVDGKLEGLIGGMTDLVTEELNVKSVVFESDLGKYMNLALKPNFKLAGPALGGRIKDFAAALNGADAAALNRELEEKGFAEMSVGGEATRVERDFVEVQISAKPGFTVAMENNLFAILDTTITKELLSEGLAREFVSKVQQIRKQRDFEMMDQISVVFSGDGELAEALEEHRGYVMKETLAVSLSAGATEAEEWDLNGHKTRIEVERQ
ncbi:MAG: isoleucine--tRNA ligase [Clostridiales Family XIII bacterium]|jgi:isoleucyl-tRNA synthetase|nr:isoleucine--tRNA ligase [Clostridiales Family XIII bacterium]